MSQEFASEIYSSSTPGSEEVQEKTVDLQPDEQETHSNEQETHHTSSIQTEAFDYLYRSVESLSITDCPRNDTSSQTEEFDFLFAESATSKPFDKNILEKITEKCHFTQVCQHTKCWKPLLIMFRLLSNEEHNLLLYFKRWSWFS